MRSLPFTAEVFLSLFEEYNRAIWPAQVLAYGLGIAAVLLALRPLAGGRRIVAAILSAFWLWNGVAYHLIYFASINFAAVGFGMLFVLQGLLFAASAARGQPAFRFDADLSGWSGLCLAVFAMGLYPLLGVLAGHGWPQAAVFGVAPCPTVIFTFGMLLMTEGRAPLHLVLMPFLWSLIGASAVLLLGMTEDFSLLLAGVAGLGLILRKNRAQSPRAERYAP
jgi:hypothetical protein